MRTTSDGTDGKVGAVGGATRPRSPGSQATVKVGGVEPSPPAKRTYVSQSDVPAEPLEEALRVPEAIRDQYGGKPVSPFDLALALGINPKGSQLEVITGASIAYGLTEGGSRASTIALTDLGRRIVSPVVDGDELPAKQEAFLKPRVIGTFIKKYDGSPLPSDTVALNVLKSMGVDGPRAQRTLDLIKSGAASLRLLVQIKDKQYVRLGVLAATASQNGTTNGQGDPTPAPVDVLEAPIAPLPPAAPSPSDERPVAKPIFLGHGKKKAPLEKLEKILGSFGIPYKTAITEPNLGRPIPKKVKDVMSQCGSAILIFTCDEEFGDKDGNTIWRPSENVVHELGAASFAYEDRVVIFKERGLFFPANYQSIGHIEFEEDSIESKTMELLKELIGFGLVRIAPAV